MALFAIMAPLEDPDLAKELARLFPGDHIRLGTGQWIVSYAGTTPKELSDSLGISDARTGLGVVVRIAGYYGRANPEIWEWMAARLQGSPG